MKKLFVMAVAAIAMLSVGCGNKTATSANGADSIPADSSEMVATTGEAVAEELATAVAGKDAESVQSTFEKIKAEYERLVNEGKLEEAKTYASKIQEFINNHAEELSALTTGNATISGLVNTVKNLPTSAKTTAEEAAAAVKSDVENAAKNAVENVKEEAANKVNEAATKAVNNAAEKVNKAAEDANKKVNDAVNKGVGKLLGK